jgi:lipopolysaccharide/colanic/teichoic acid biosynthesis glycosyltransferase
MNSDLQSKLKRTLDVIVAGFCLVLLCPVIALIALSILACMGRPVFFRHPRAGYRGRAFTVFKSRTMIEAYDEEGRPLSDKARITSLGRFLRKTSLDELPQLVNVLSGDMSLVGPRPLKIEYLRLYSSQQARRHEVKPGITGLAQIKGRNMLSWDERFALDVWYVDHASLLLDLQILLQTIISVLRRDSVSADGDLDIPSFTGSLSADHPQSGVHYVSGGLP